MNNEPQNMAMIYVPTLRERIGNKLFPGHHIDIPDKPGMMDCLVVRTEAVLSWRARIQILVSGRAFIETKTATQNAIGECQTVSAFTVRAPLWLQPRSR